MAVITFIKTHISNPKYTGLLVDVVNVLIDMYAVLISQSGLIDELFSRIRQKVSEEVRLHEQVMEVVGVMDLLLVNNE